MQSFSAPTITSINPPRGLIGQEHTVTINGSAFGPAPQVNVSGAGVTAQVVSSSDTQIQVKLRVRSDATAGNHGITVTNPAGTSNRRDFFVQVPSKFTFVSVESIPLSELGCVPPRQPGFTAQARLQVVDQQGIPIRSLAMVPEESVSVEPNSPTFSPFLPFASPNNTDQNGILLDKPIGTCFLIEPRIDVCAIVTQRFQVVVSPGSGLGSQRTFPISTQAVRADCGFGMDYSLEEGGVTVVRVQMGTLPL